MKEIIVAESAGFCFGVSRSVKLAEKAISESGPCFSLGELIHNDAVVADLESRGLTVASTVESIPDGARFVVRSHGITRAEFEALRAKKRRNN